MLLEDYIALYAERRFGWEHDSCAHFAARWVRAQENLYPLRGLPRFGGPMEAGHIISRYGGTLRDAVTQMLARAPLETPRLAQLGDIVLLPGGFHGTLGICNGLRAAVLSEEGGVVFVEMEQAEAAWRVAP